MIHQFKSVESTQENAKELVAKGEFSHLDAVRAEVQSAGRGRQGKEWLSGSGNLYTSIFLKEFSLPLTWIPHWIGVSTLQALKQLGFSDQVLKLKWPNDLYWNSDHKVGGILCEKVEQGVIAGVGINIHSAPSLQDRKCASLNEICGGGLPLGFAHSLLDTLIQVLQYEPSPSSLRDAYDRASLYKKGDVIQWKDVASGIPGQGEVMGLGDHGELQVCLESGQIKSLFSEEISGLNQKG